MVTRGGGGGDGDSGGGGGGEDGEGDDGGRRRGGGDILRTRVHNFRAPPANQCLGWSPEGQVKKGESDPLR